jgi:predicted DNA-binding protein
MNPMKRTKAKTKPVRLDLSPEDHEILKTICKLKGKTMAGYVRWLVERRIRNFRKGD